MPGRRQWASVAIGAILLVGLAAWADPEPGRLSMVAEHARELHPFSRLEVVLRVALEHLAIVYQPSVPDGPSATKRRSAQAEDSDHPVVRPRCAVGSTTTIPTRWATAACR